MITSLYKGEKKFDIQPNNTEDPAAGEVQIKVAFSGVCGTDMHIFHGMMDKRVPMPMTIGHEMSGTVSQLGDGVSGYEIGDKVVVRPLDNRAEKPSDKGHSHICKDLKFIGIDSPGSMQSLWNVPAFTLHKLPPHTDLKLAALVEPLAVACHDVKLSGLQSGEVAVVLGGGPIGMLVAMVASTTGAKVYISEVNPARLALAKELGFQTIDPTQEDVVQKLETETGGRLADVVFEVAGVQPTVDLMTKIAGIRGRVVMVAIHGEARPVDLFQFFWKELKLIGARVYEEDDFDKAIELVADGALPLDKMITRIAHLSEIQNVFEGIDNNPDGMKVLMDCQK